jgi:hypothetical protein
MRISPIVHHAAISVFTITRDPHFDSQEGCPQLLEEEQGCCWPMLAPPGINGLDVALRLLGKPQLHFRASSFANRNNRKDPGRTSQRHLFNPSGSSSRLHQETSSETRLPVLVPSRRIVELARGDLQKLSHGVKPSPLRPA